MEYKIFHNPEKKDKEFWSLTGWFFASRQVEKELGAPIHHDDGMIWIVAIQDGQSVAVSAVQIKKNGIGYLKHSYTLPEFRRQGIFSDILKIRLDLLKDTKAIRSTSTNMSLPIMLKSGFKKYGTRGKYTLVEYE